jgi:murein DD-endopeptidase MepM/ murein hydrolase activator NlpD
MQVFPSYMTLISSCGRFLFRPGVIAILLILGLWTTPSDAHAQGPRTWGAVYPPPATENPDSRGGPAGLKLLLPTSNDALLRGDEAGFYQDLERTIPGMRRYRWEGGRYGFVRNEARTPAGRIFSRLHQGVDIRPLHRDRNGVPLDTVRAIDDGTVVYVNRVERNSSYGRYAVIEHLWDGSPVYTLLAHLETVVVRPGQAVAAGDPIGRMGYTGRGLNRQRAHVHMEIGLLLNESFELWHRERYSSPNHHGLYNGLNLRGVDVASLYLEIHHGPPLTFAEFVRSRPVAFRLALPGEYPLEILKRYPWLSIDGSMYGDEGPGAWLLGFTREGVPVEVSRSDAPTSEPRVIFVSQEVRRGYLGTGGWLSREGSEYTVGRTGRSYAALMLASRAGVPDWR